MTYVALLGLFEIPANVPYYVPLILLLMLHCLIKTISPISVRTHVRLYTRSFVHTFVRTHDRLYTRSFVRMVVRTYVCSYVRTHVHSYARSFLRMFVRTHVRNSTRSFALKVIQSAGARPNHTTQIWHNSIKLYHIWRVRVNRVHPDYFFFFDLRSLTILMLPSL